MKTSAVLATPGVFSLIAYGSVFLPWFVVLGLCAEFAFAAAARSWQVLN